MPDERFEREGRRGALASMVLAVHAFGRTGDCVFIVFDLLEETTRRERLASGRLPLRKTIAYVRVMMDVWLT